jgi:hypothetical protein
MIIVPTSSRHRADSRLHSIAVHVQMNELTQGHTEYTLTVSALFNEAHDGKATAGSAKVGLLTRSPLPQWQC